MRRFFCKIPVSLTEGRTTISLSYGGSAHSDEAIAAMNEKSIVLVKVVDWP
jgi:hypothetical protein